MSGGVREAVVAARADQNITHVEMQRILRAIEADGVVSQGEKALLGRLRNDLNGAELTREARQQLDAYLERYSGSGDAQVLNETSALELLRTTTLRHGEDHLTRDDLQTIIDSPTASTELIRAARFALENFDRLSNLTRTQTLEPGRFESAGGLHRRSPRGSMRTRRGMRLAERRSVGSSSWRATS